MESSIEFTFDAYVEWGDEENDFEAEVEVEAEVVFEAGSTVVSYARIVAVTPTNSELDCVKKNLSIFQMGVLEEEAVERFPDEKKKADEDLALAAAGL